MYIKLFLILSSIVLGDIPKRIIQTGPNEEVEEFKGIPGRMQVKNEDFSYDFFNDDRMFEFMQEHFPESELLEVFLDERVPIVMKSDLFRLAVVASIGGFYMDMDVYAYKNMEPLLKEKAVFPKEWKKNDEDFEARHGTLPEDEEERWQVGNYAFGSEANHPLVLDALEEAVKRTKALLEEEGELQDDDVLKSTGPYMLSEVFHKGRKEGKYDDVNFLEGGDQIPLFPKSHGSRKWHKFGDYAEHVITHTWVRRRLATEEELAEILWQNSLKEDQDMAWAKGVIQELKHRFGELTISATDNTYSDVYTKPKKDSKKKPLTPKKKTTTSEEQTANYLSHKNWKRGSSAPDTAELEKSEKEARKLARVEGLESKKVNDQDLEWAVGVLKRHFVKPTDDGFEIAVGDTYYNDNKGKKGKGKKKGKKKNMEAEGQLGGLNAEDVSKKTTGPQEDIPLSTRVFIFAGIVLSVSILVYVWNSKPTMQEERLRLLAEYDGDTVEARTA